MTRARLLVVDDKDSFLALFRRVVPPEIEIVCASDGARALELLASEPFDVVVTDVRMPGADGMTVLRKVREAGLDVDVILMTAYGTIGDAVKAMKLGAAEYLTKPFDPDDAVAAIQAALERRRARGLDASAQRLPPTQLLGRSPAMRNVHDLVLRAAASDAPVLIAGESGTGKELVARTVHERSARSARRFVPVNCGALAEAAVDDELFGHVRGAVTGAVGARRGAFEEAPGGTLFLDEVEALPLPAQVKVARAIEERLIRRRGSTEEHPIDVRIIASTDIDLARAVEQGRFRPELYDRLNVLAIDVPPLRDRTDDLPVLADAVLRKTLAGGVEAPRLDDDTLAALAAYHWPGNVRQLENVLARVVAAGVADVLTVEMLPDDVRSGARAPAPSTTPLVSLPYREAIAVERERATREYLAALLRDCQGNVTQAAERAGIERESFHRLMKRHGIRSEDFRSR